MSFLEILKALLKGDIKKAVKICLNYLGLRAIFDRDVIKNIETIYAEKKENDTELVKYVLKVGDELVEGEASLEIYGTCIDSGDVCFDPIGFLASTALLKGSPPVFKSVSEFKEKVNELDTIDKATKLNLLIDLLKR